MLIKIEKKKCENTTIDLDLRVVRTAPLGIAIMHHMGEVGTTICSRAIFKSRNFWMTPRIFIIKFMT